MVSFKFAVTNDKEHTFFLLNCFSSICHIFKNSVGCIQQELANFSDFKDGHLREKY
jgi:hypothetical protein